MKKKQAIVVVSFGTTYIDSLKACIEPIERVIAETFGSCAVYRAFTSAFVRKRLAEYGIMVNSLPEILDKLKHFLVVLIKRVCSDKHSVHVGYFYIYLL